MEIKKENIISAYNSADENGKRMLIALFGEEAVKQADKRPVTERVKTFQDAREAIGEDHKLCRAWRALSDDDAELAPDVEAYLELRIIAAALNEGWKPQFTEDEWRWYPWFTLWTEEELSEMSDEWKADRHLISIGDYSGGYAGFACAFSNYSPSYTYTYIGSHLCFKSEALATYCGKQFISLWADFNLIKN